MPFPLPLETLLGKPLMYLVFGLIGFGFGYVLEISGFGDSRKLAAQFYFKDLTVLKVMFTAIVVAMVLIFAMVGLGLLDYNQVWVNPTYLWSGIVGGLIMGVGFIVGGFCPGTSLVSAATLKLDGVFFVLGGLTGIFLFGETVSLYEDWWNGSYFGRLTIMDWLNAPTGAVVVGIVLMALFMFWGGEQLERIFGKRDLAKEPKLRVAATGALLLGALVVLFIGAPDTAQKWARIAIEKEALLAERQVQIHPGELLTSMADDQLRVVMLDVRSESDYNLFHIEGAKNAAIADLPALSRSLTAETSNNTVYVVISNDEAAATDAWKIMVAESVPNVYILEGGVNNWLLTFAAEEEDIQPTPTPPGGDALGYTFPAALGARYEASFPNPHEWELEFTPKIKLQLKRDKSGGGCG
ncbi:MAG: YeeE/YedE family protein [Chloroflexi bacterium]|nr:YeeE/YedE family protein [Chloroflexota bacterium]